MMMAMSCFFSHAMAGDMIQFVRLLKVLCLFFAMLKPGYGLDPHISDHMAITKVASIAPLNRWIKCRKYFFRCCHIGYLSTLPECYMAFRLHDLISI